MSEIPPSDDEPPASSSTAIVLLEQAPGRAELAVLDARGSASPPDPRLVYLAGLTTAKSRRGMTGALDRIARAMSALGGAPITAAALPWHLLRYQHTSALRAALIAEYAPATVNQALAALRGVLREAYRLRLVSAEDLARAVDLKPAKGSRLPPGRALELEELRKLLGACDLGTAAGTRDAALLAILYNCGLRRSELVALDLADYEPTARRFKVLGKGNKERLVYVTAAAEALERWLQRRGDAPGPLFLPVNKGGQIGMRRLSDQSVLFLLARLAELAGVADFSPHDIRRTFIGDLLDAGADISVVQKLAGHALVTTTQRYDRRGENTKKRAAGLIRF